MKSLIDRLINKPEWQHPDPAVRADAVLRLPSAEREVLLGIAREDTEPRVRRAAAKKLERWQRIADSAMKQSGRSWRCEVLPAASVQDAVERYGADADVVVADEAETAYEAALERDPRCAPARRSMAAGSTRTPTTFCAVKISAPSRRACTVARLARSVPLTPLGKPR